MTYRIVRMYADSREKSRDGEGGLTLAEAKAHCADPETNSRTCTRPVNVAHTRVHGPWFDGYEEE